MHTEILHEAGLSPNEARVYEAMLQMGESSVQAISLKAGVHRRNVYDSLAKLVEKGLASQYIVKGEQYYRATDPERLLIMLKVKEDKLTAILPELKRKFLTPKQEEQAYIYRGVQGFRNYMQDIIDGGEDFYCIGAKGGWFDPRLRTFRIRFYKELRKKNIKCHHLFDHEMRSHIGRDMESPVQEHLEEARFLPKGYSTRSAIDIFADRVVTFTGLNINRLDDDMVQFVLVSRELAESYKKWFWLLWEKCEEV